MGQIWSMRSVLAPSVSRSHRPGSLKFVLPRYVLFFLVCAFLFFVILDNGIIVKLHACMESLVEQLHFDGLYSVL